MEDHRLAAARAAPSAAATSQPAKPRLDESRASIAAATTIGLATHSARSRAKACSASRQEQDEPAEEEHKVAAAFEAEVAEAETHQRPESLLVMEEDSGWIEDGAQFNDVQVAEHILFGKPSEPPAEDCRDPLWCDPVCVCEPCEPTDAAAADDVRRNLRKFL